MQIFDTNFVIAYTSLKDTHCKINNEISQDTKYSVNAEEYYEPRE